MKIIDKKISLEELEKMADAFSGVFVKGVVDLNKQVLALDAEMHADLEARLLEEGSRQQNLWGINLYPFKTGEDFLEFDSMINIRPRQNNCSRGVDDASIRQNISELVERLTK